MRLPHFRLTTRRIMLLGLVIAFILGGWVEWTGRRARAIKGSRRHGQAEYDRSVRLDDYLHEIRGSTEGPGDPPQPGPPVARLSLPREALKAEAGRELTVEERRLIDEHIRARPETWAFASPIPFPLASLKILINQREMIQPGWLIRTLREEAEHRRLRKQYEHAINRPWIAIPLPDPTAQP